MKRIVGLIFFALLYAILSVLFLFYLDLANGPMFLLFVEIGIILLGLVSRFIFRKRKWLLRNLTFAILIVLNIPVLMLAKPKTVSLDAVLKNATKTEVLNLEKGKIQGVLNEDKTVRVYAGIPYAKAPINELRWKEPQDVEPWTDIRDCSKFAPRAMQVDTSPIMNTLIDIYSSKGWHPNYKMDPLQNMSEDCLYLNIWRPNNNETNLPIVVYIHGGSLTTGSGAAYDINGETYARNNVIMITVTYRLGVFGYYANQELINESVNHTTGNYGLLDQIKALKWVNDNASYFGGNKDNITIAGESAGSSSVSALCVSPLAKGLFKRAIGESSSLIVKTPPHTFRTMEKALETGNNIMKEFNVSSIEELRKIPAEKLVQTKYSNSGMTLDGYAITKLPYQVYKDKENNEEALLNGYNVKEADAFVIPTFLFNKTNKNNIRERIAAYFEDETIADKICNLYKERIEEDAFSVLNEVISVYWFIQPHHSSSLAALDNNIPVYRYQFTKENGFYGTYHSGEIVYAYGNLYRSNKKYAYNDSDYKLQDIMVAYFTNFIKNGNPNGENLPLWEQYQANGQIMELGENVGKIDDKYKEVYTLIEEYLNK